MISYFDLKDFFSSKPYHLILASDAQPFIHKSDHGNTIVQNPAGGVSVALEPVAKAAHALFIARGRTAEDKATADEKGYFPITGIDSYTLRRLFLTPEQLDNYYYGYANQTMWPLCHIAFESPTFNPLWWQEYKEVNELFAKTIEEEAKGNNLLWINDYQLSLVPGMLRRQQDRIIALFWHIPWPTWEIFRILPRKKIILEHMLGADLIGFHRHYQAENFIDTVRQELEVRIDQEKGTIYYKDHATTIKNFPMGIDVDVIQSLTEPDDDSFLTSFVKSIFNLQTSTTPIDELFHNNKVLLGVDRLDYTKGLLHRMKGLWRFFEKYPEFREKVTYVGFAASSRDQIPSYIDLKKQVETIAKTINRLFGTNTWKPIQLSKGIFSRHELIKLYQHAAATLVTPLDDGMNLVSKEYIVAASQAKDPGMLILSQFAGSATDLSEALIVNPYDTEALANAIHKALVMPVNKRKERIHAMAEKLSEHNVYAWAMDFLKAAESAAKENRKVNLG